ncbi:hypothetical protein WJX72_002653 [[Myrmecia] bisecta]|uniref:Glyoxalase/fosfomycin resistance/dioxygenase domain-containing protein n=1 Tax=[Myrmecia] bisecta TaxID=41462 RepID=A0AAW1P2Z5_9CHLO
MKLTSTLPLLVVDEIEPCIPFYKNTLDYEVKNEVKDEAEKLFYICFGKGDHNVKLTTKAFLAKELPAEVMQHLKAPGASYLYHSVEELDVDLIKQQAGAKLLHGPHSAMYGATEAYVLDVSGHMHVFGEWRKMEAKANGAA